MATCLLVATCLIITVVQPSAQPKRRTGPQPPPISEPPDAQTKVVHAWAAMEARAEMRPFTYDLPSTTPPAGYVDVEISHCGICHSDLHQINDAWRVACFPLVPGHEIVGTIAAIGSGVDNFAVGDRAAIGVQRSCCGSCDCCDAGLDHVSSTVSVTVMT